MIIVVTGTTKGIGQAVAQAFLQEKTNSVFGIARSQSTLEQCPKYQHFQGDLLQKRTFQHLERELTSSFHNQPVDILVLNAGVARVSPALPLDSQLSATTLELNLISQIRLIETLEPVLSSSCLIIAISSVSDRLYGEGFAAYSASKAGLNAYLGTLALERPDWQILTLLPSYVNTALLHSLGVEIVYDHQDILQPGDVATSLMRVVAQRSTIPSGARIIIVNDALVADQENPEQLYVLNATSGKLTSS